MTNEQETAIARLIVRSAEQWVRAYSLDCDQSAATAAVLVRALELATPDLSPTARARLFLEDES